MPRPQTLPDGNSPTLETPPPASPRAAQPARALLPSHEAAEAADRRSFADGDLIAWLPHLRAFARSLTGNRERADDLVQDTAAIALASAHQFEPGTNLKAWLFTILRHQHYSDVRPRRFRVQSIDESAIDEPAVAATQEARLEFDDFRRAFWQLAESHREVLLLIGMSGLSYEEAAEVCNCPTGTIRSRVSRARQELVKALREGPRLSRREDRAVNGEQPAASPRRRSRRAVPRALQGRDRKPRADAG